MYYLQGKETGKYEFYELPIPAPTPTPTHGEIILAYIV